MSDWMKKLENDLEKVFAKLSRHEKRMKSKRKPRVRGYSSKNVIVTRGER